MQLQRMVITLKYSGIMTLVFPEAARISTENPSFDAK